MTITDPNGRERLSLQCEDGNFQALVWSFEQDGQWHCRAVITQSDFQAGHPLDRWIAELHSFDPDNGHAIIRVGETQPPLQGDPNKLQRAIYSWREWNLLKNREIRMLQVCYDSSEDYDPDATQSGHDDSLVVIDCKDEDWDSALYLHLYNRRFIELRNLHSSYEKFMNQLAELHSMEFVPYFAENRGEFKRLYDTPTGS